MISKMKTFFLLCAFAPLLTNAFLYFNQDKVTLSNYQKTKGFSYLEPVKGKGKVGGKAADADSYYFVNDKPATWEEAKELCKKAIGSEATLVSFETKEELVKIESAIKSSSKTSFWTDGMYGNCGEGFVWGRGDPLGDWVPWESQKPTNPSEIDRVTMIKNNDQWKIKASEKTELHSYICEVNMTMPTGKLPCQKTYDMIILIDASGSTNDYDETDFEYAKSEFAKTMTSNWKQWNNTRVAYFKFANNVYEDIESFGFNDNLTDFDRGDIIDTSSFVSSDSSPDIAKALAFSDKYFTDMKSINNEQRVLLISSGETSDKGKAIAAAEDLRGKKVQIFVVTMSDNPDQALLTSLSNGTIFWKNEYAKLNNELKPSM